MKTLIEELHI